MGSCISKCRPKKKLKEEDPCHHIHDKLVISRDPPPIIVPEITILPSDKPLSPAPSTSSVASFSSFSYSTHSKSVVASSISSSSSSSLSSSSSSSYSSSVLKDRSFSNDYLWSCAKENPHAVGLNQRSVEKPAQTALLSKARQTAPETVKASTTPKKRARAASPTLVRQKSFRKEQNCPNRGLRSSPSPSRRFNGESNRIFPVKDSYYRKPVSSAPKRESFRAPSPKRESFRAPTPSPRRESFRAPTPSPRRESFRAPTPSPKREMSNGGEYSSSVRKNEAFSQQISSKIDGREIDDVVMEDINNPLIALDCFIFL